MGLFSGVLGFLRRKKKLEPVIPSTKPKQPVLTRQEVIATLAGMPRKSRPATATSAHRKDYYIRDRKAHRMPLATMNGWGGANASLDRKKRKRKYPHKKK